MSGNERYPDGNLEVSESVLIAYVEKTIGEFTGITLSKRKKAVKITRTDDGNIIDIGLDVKYGVKIPEIVKALQQTVVERIMKLAGVEVKEVNVLVEGLNIEELIKR